MNEQNDLDLCLEVVSKVMSTIALHSTSNISETVRDRGLVPKAHVPIRNGIWSIKWSRCRWRHGHVTLKGQTRDPNKVRAQYLENGWHIWAFKWLHGCDVTWPWNVKVVTPIRLKRNISKTAGDRDSVQKKLPIGNCIWAFKWSRGRWRHRVNPKGAVRQSVKYTNIFGTVGYGYPSDSLASCSTVFLVKVCLRGACMHVS